MAAPVLSSWSTVTPLLPSTLNPSSAPLSSARRTWSTTPPPLRYVALFSLCLLTVFLFGTPQPIPPPNPTFRSPPSPPFYDSPLSESEPGNRELPPSCGLRPPSLTVHIPSSTPNSQFTTPTPSLPLNATLLERLAIWRSSPSLSHEDWTALNAKTCATSSVRGNWNKLHVGLNEGKWAAMDGEEVGKTREELIGVLERKQKEGEMEFRYEGKRGRRGVLFTAGNADTFERVIVILRLLRSYGTVLPVEVWHFESEQPTSAQLFEYEKYDAVTRVVDVSKDDQEGRAKAFHIKGAAMLQSEFEEFLYLDSDSIPTKDVTPLFDSAGFREYGAMFWPDYWKDSADNAIWSIIGVQCRDEWTQEAGQLLLDKSRHLDVLHLVHHMLDVAHYSFWFSLSDGDKDLFRYSMLALRKRWAVPGRHLATASWLDDNFLGKNEFCGHTMLQHDAAGEPAFVHGNLLKRIVAGLEKGSTWGKTTALSLPPLSSADLNPPLSADHLANIDSLGRGIVIHPSPSVLLASAAEQGLRTHFHDGFRGNAYVLCVGTTYEQPRPQTGCEENSMEARLRSEEVELKATLWENVEVLKGFEEAFYGKLGVPNNPMGVGLR